MNSLCIILLFSSYWNVVSSKPSVNLFPLMQTFVLGTIRSSLAVSIPKQPSPPSNPSFQRNVFFLNRLLFSIAHQEGLKFFISSGWPGGSTVRGVGFPKFLVGLPKSIQSFFIARAGVKHSEFFHLRFFFNYRRLLYLLHQWKKIVADDRDKFY